VRRNQHQTLAIPPIAMGLSMQHPRTIPTHPGRMFPTHPTYPLGAVAADPLADDDPESLGDYQLIGRLGEGGMGTVYLGVGPLRDGQPAAGTLADTAARTARDGVEIGVRAGVGAGSGSDSDSDSDSRADSGRGTGAEGRPLGEPNDGPGSGSGGGPAASPAGRVTAGEAAVIGPGGIEGELRLVAIKMIRADLARLPEFRERFLREADMARRVARFCTAEVVEVVDPPDGPPYLVTEYIDGLTLTHAVLAGGPLRTGDLERLAVSVAAALTAIHGAGLVHRDLKPSNVILSSLGPRVIDFGIARATDAHGVLSHEVQRIGTPAFMAPEQANGQPVTAAADIFAWGGLVTYAGTGVLPFGDGPTPVQLYRVVHLEPNLEGLGPALRPIVEHAMRKDPAERPTAQDLFLRLVGMGSPTHPDPAVSRAIRSGAIPGQSPGTTAGGAGQAADIGSSQAGAEAVAGDAAIATDTVGRAGVLDRPGSRGGVRGTDGTGAAGSAGGAGIAGGAGGAVLGTVGGSDADYGTGRGGGGAVGTHGFTGAPVSGPGEAAGVAVGALGEDGPAGVDARGAATGPTPRTWRDRLRHGCLMITPLLALMLVALLIPVVLGRTPAPNPTPASLATEVAVAADKIRSTDAGLADALSLAAFRISPAPTARASLRTSFAGAAALPLSGHIAAVLGVAVSPDGRLAATASADGTTRLWDLAAPAGRAGPTAPGAPPARPAPLAVLRGHDGWVTAAAFSPDGTLLATAGYDRSVLLWDLHDPVRPVRLATLTGHEGYVLSVAFSPDGGLLATSGYDDTARIWDVHDPNRPVERSVLTGHGGWVRQVAFSPDSRLLATASTDRTARLWDIGDPRHPRTLATLSGHTDYVWTVAFSPDGRQLATGGYDGTARLWDVTDPGRARPLETIKADPQWVLALAFSPDGRTLATAGRDDTVHLWDLTADDQPAAVGQLTGHTDWIQGLAFTPDGQFVLTAAADHTARLTPLDDGTLLAAACRTDANELDPVQWQRYIPSAPYRPVC